MKDAGLDSRASQHFTVRMKRSSQQETEQEWPARDKRVRRGGRERGREIKQMFWKKRSQRGHVLLKGFIK